MKTFYTFLLCFTFSWLNAQLESANWYFGVRAGLNFSSETPEVVYDGAMTTGEGCAAISDPMVICFSTPTEPKSIAVSIQRCPMVTFYWGTHRVRNLQ